MRAGVHPAPGPPLLVHEVPEPVAPTGGAVVDVLACGICHPDLHPAAGDYPPALPVILGHEVAACRSEWQMPQASTSTTAPPVGATGSGTS